MQNIWRLLKLIPHYRRQLVVVFVMNGLLGLYALGIPFVYKSVVNSIVALAQHTSTMAQATRSVTIALVILVVVSILGDVIEYYQERRSDLLFVGVMTDLRERIYAHMIKVSIDYYEQNRVGDIIQRFGFGVMEVARWVYSVVSNMLSSILAIAFIMILLWVKFPLIAFIMTAGSIFFVWSTVHKVKQTRPIRKRWIKMGEEMSGQLTETIGQIATVRSFGQDHVRLDDYIKSVSGFRRARISQFAIEWRSNFWRSSVMDLATTLSFAVIALEAVHGKASAGDILLISLYLQTIRSRIMPITRLITDTGDIESAAKRITELLDVKPTVVDRPDAVVLDEIKTIEFKDVSFTYPGKGQTVLEGISFKVESGQSLALVGPSGVGKSTITKLLLRFYEATSGEIMINGQDIRSYKQDSLRQHVGMVMQDVALFNDSIENNLRFAQPKADRSTIEAAAKEAHAAEFIDKLPSGYNTIVGERGIKLSGGQKQRVAIARAILRDPHLIILDEATSALDSESEQLVQDGLKRLMEGRTAIIIAHRLSTVMQSDQIIVLQKGRISERGNHDELVNKKTGLYARLFALQQGGDLK
jgi:ABC-type multidrug transport system fused ATPase/permease subunit